MNVNPPNLNIKDLTLSVKRQLQEVDSARIANKELATFNVDYFDLEINFVIKQTDSKNSNLEYSIITVGNGSEFSKEQTQKITLRMKALDEKPIEVEPD